MPGGFPVLITRLKREFHSRNGTNLNTILLTNKTTTMKQKTITILYALCLLSVIAGKAQITIPPAYFGQNAWMPDSCGTGTSGRVYGKLDTNWTYVQQSNVKIMRFGGINANGNKPSNSQYLRIVDSMRRNGIEPILQVPFNTTFDSANARKTRSTCKYNLWSQGEILEHRQRAGSGPYQLHQRQTDHRLYQTYFLCYEASGQYHSHRRSGT